MFGFPAEVRRAPARIRAGSIGAGGENTNISAGSIGAGDENTNISGGVVGA